MNVHFRTAAGFGRAALEQALKENLGYQGPRIFLEMNDLLDESEGQA